MPLLGLRVGWLKAIPVAEQLHCPQPIRAVGASARERVGEPARWQAAAAVGRDLNGTESRTRSLPIERTAAGLDVAFSVGAVEVAVAIGLTTMISYDRTADCVQTYRNECWSFRGPDSDTLGELTLLLTSERSGCVLGLTHDRGSRWQQLRGGGRGF